MHTPTIKPHLSGYLVECPEGCNLGTSAQQLTRPDAERRAKLHQTATRPWVSWPSSANQAPSDDI